MNSDTQSIISASSFVADELAAQHIDHLTDTYKRMESERHQEVK